MSSLQEIKNALDHVRQDSTTPRNVKQISADILKLLDDPGEISMKVSKALHMLEEVTEDTNVDSQTRMQLLSIVSMLSGV